MPISKICLFAKNFLWKSSYLINTLVRELFDPGTSDFGTQIFYNQFHNILRLFNVLPNFPFTTSEMMGD